MTDGKDIFKDTILRYAAFANDFGEVLRDTAVVKFGQTIGNRLANSTHVVTVSYAVGDVYNTYQRHLPDRALARTEATDCAIWQLFASVLVTPLLLKGGCIGLSRMLRNTRLSPVIKAYAPPALSLSTIPVVVPLIDQKTDDLMDRYYRATPKARVHHGLFW